MGSETECDLKIAHVCRLWIEYLGSSSLSYLDLKVSYHYTSQFISLVLFGSIYKSA